MEPENQDAPEVLETPENVEQETTNETPNEPELSPEEIAELKAKAAKADELEEKNKQLFERAKKAESKKVPSSEDGLSSKDVLYLAKADIHSDDVDDILTYAKKMNVSVSEAHKFFKPILAERAEERKSAQASHVKGGARGASKTSGDDLLRKAEQTGEVPESAEGMNALFAARQAQKLKN